MSERNIFQMLVAHGGPGFWVRRTTWGGTCARVVAIGEMTGPAPYYGNPPVLMDVYTDDGRLKDSAARLPVPGTYKTWRWIDPPSWATNIKLRALDDPALEAELTRVDKRGRSRAANRPSPVEPVWLNVPFPRKDEAKEIGARWSPGNKCWWLPADDTDALAKARALGFLK